VNTVTLALNLCLRTAYTLSHFADIQSKTDGSRSTDRHGGRDVQRSLAASSRGLQFQLRWRWVAT